MKNLELAEIFRSIAKLLEVKGDNPFRIRAYERAAQNIESIENIEEYAEQDKLETIPAIGKDLADKIKEYLSTGKIRQYEEIKKRVPEGVLELLKVPSIGPKTAKLFYENLKIKDIPTLERFAKEGKLLEIEGIKEKTVKNIISGIALIKKGQERFDLGTAWQIAQMFIDELHRLKVVKMISPAGSLRRMKETVKDIDLLVTSTDAEKAMEYFCSLKEVKQVLAKGPTKSTILSRDGIQIDIRVVEPESFGAALIYFTGSKSHNIKLRTLATKRNLLINEYGVFKDNKVVASKTETDVYKYLGMDYIHPELREDIGEIEAAISHNLPKLVELNQIKGDLHIHSNYSDGNNTILEIAKACQQLNYEYIAITDHSQSLRVASGLSINELKRKKKQIERINKMMEHFKVLYGTEVEIDKDGNIDYPDSVLKEFDIVVGAIHSGFKQSKEQLTKRIIAACKNPHVDIIAHLTGRHWGVREPYELDFSQVFKVAKETNTILEINANPLRLDINDMLIRAAYEKGCRFVISTDAHNIEHLRFMRFGVAMARRGWLEKNDIINCLTLDELLKTIKR